MLIISTPGVPPIGSFADYPTGGSYLGFEYH
jgi:hypothetical protein